MTVRQMLYKRKRRFFARHSVRFPTRILAGLLAGVLAAGLLAAHPVTVQARDVSDTLNAAAASNVSDTPNAGVASNVLDTPNAAAASNVSDTPNAGAASASKNASDKATTLASESASGETAISESESTSDVHMPEPERVWAKVPETGELTEISEEVREMLLEESIWLDTATGYLYDADTGWKVHPISGERQKESSGETAPEEGAEVLPGTEDPGKDERTEPNSEEVTVQEEASKEVPSNEALIARQQIVRMPIIIEDYRFWTVARKYAFAREELLILEEMDEENARAVGTISENGVLYVLKEEDDGWLYVESGTVRGFVREEEVLLNEEAQECLKAYQEQARKKAEEEEVEYTGIEGVAPVAKELLPRQENEAFLHIRATVNQTVVEKDYAIVRASLLNIREEQSTDSRIVGTLVQGGLCYILADKGQEWSYVESGDVRGFVKSEYLDYDEEMKEISPKDAEFEETVETLVESQGEDTFPVAQELIRPEDNAACYYTFKSIKSGIPGGEVRTSLLEFASQFIGNPYVWGGTSLTDGADCSGFVQSIYREYGYSLPRVARDQSQYGTQIPVEDAQPGDLIFYAKNGNIYHVVIYAGDGTTIEAKGRAYGIVQGTLDTEHAVWAARILQDSQYTYTGGGINAVNATEDMYGTCLGSYKLTYYCSCELCCDVETGITATGTPVIEGQTIAVDPSVIPYGTKVIINGHIFTAEDCGGAVNGNHIDIYVNDHAKALALGVGNANVYLLK